MSPMKFKDWTFRRTVSALEADTMSNTELLGIAAHLHVLLRRKAGRVTDIEWMVSNHEYAQAIVRFSRAKAVELNFSDLELWALKLESVLSDSPPQVARKPLMQTAVESVRASRAAHESLDFSPSLFPSSRLAEETLDAENAAPRYVGGIR
jgi:hypothetical protein